jgi:hypothetical protein
MRCSAATSLALQRIVLAFVTRPRRVRAERRERTSLHARVGRHPL